MTKPETPKKRGRPPCSRNRPKPTRPLRELLAEDFTEKDVKKLTPAQRARLLAALEPRGRAPQDEPVQVVFNLQGVRRSREVYACPRCGFVPAVDGTPVKGTPTPAALPPPIPPGPGDPPIFGSTE